MVPGKAAPFRGADHTTGRAAIHPPQCRDRRALRPARLARQVLRRRLREPGIRRLIGLVELRGRLGRRRLIDHGHRPLLRRGRPITATHGHGEADASGHSGCLPDPGRRIASLFGSAERTSPLTVTEVTATALARFEAHGRYGSPTRPSFPSRPCIAALLEERASARRLRRGGLLVRLLLRFQLADCPVVLLLGPAALLAKAAGCVLRCSHGAPS